MINLTNNSPMTRPATGDRGCRAGGGRYGLFTLALQEGPMPRYPLTNRALPIAQFAVDRDHSVPRLPLLVYPVQSGKIVEVIAKQNNPNLPHLPWKGAKAPPNYSRNLVDCALIGSSPYSCECPRE